MLINIINMIKFNMFFTIFIIVVFNYINLSKNHDVHES